MTASKKAWEIMSLKNFVLKTHIGLTIFAYLLCLKTCLMDVPGMSGLRI